MKLIFFKYTKSCEEFNILVKATNEDATRKDLKQGQLLFESIYQNIMLIDSQLYKIESTITNKNIEIDWSDGKEMFKQKVISVEYSPDFEREIKKWQYLQTSDDDYFINNIYFSIQKVLKFLGSDFDYEKHKLSALDWEKGIKEKKGGIMYAKTSERVLFFRTPIIESIEIVLEYYSKQSLKLTEYIDLFIKE